MGSIKMNGGGTGSIKIKPGGTGGSVKMGSSGGGGGGGGPFSPSSISGLTLWLKPDAGLFKDLAGTSPVTADNDVVQMWADQSGHGNNFVPDTDPYWAGRFGPAAIPSLNAVYFDGSSKLKSTVLNGRNPPTDVDFTVIVAWHVVDLNSSLAFNKYGNVQMGAKNGYAAFLQGGYDYTQESGDFASGKGGPALTYNTSIVQTLVGVKSTNFDGNNHICDVYGYVNGTSAGSIINASSGQPWMSGFDSGSGNGPVDSTHPIWLGFNGFSTSNCWVHEVLFYNKALSSTERTNVENYLKAKYSI